MCIYTKFRSEYIFFTLVAVVRNFIGRYPPVKSTLDYVAPRRCRSAFQVKFKFNHTFEGSLFFFIVFIQDNFMKFLVDKYIRSIEDDKI